MIRHQILVVDDDSEDQMILAEYFAELGHESCVKFTSNGQEAIDYLEKLDLLALPNLIVLDLNMPILGGTQTLLQIKNNNNLKNIPVIIFSTSANENEKRKCLSFGAVDYLVKPTNYADGQALIQKFLAYIS